MIDTIKIYSPETSELWKTKESVKTENYAEICIENITIKEICGYCTTIEGSLGRFLQGHNYYMDFKKIPAALEKLEALTGLDLHKAVLRRVDYAETLIVQNPCCNYLSLFRGYPRKKVAHYYNSNMTLETVQYFTKSGGEGFCIYDKNKETKDKSGKCPDIYKDCNVLRLEYRLENQTGIKNKFGGENISPWQLTKTATYTHLRKLFLDFYSGIEKGGRSVFVNLRGGKVTSRDVLLLLAESCRQCNTDFYYQTIDQLQSRGLLSAKERQRLKDKENANKANVSISDASPLIKELDSLLGV